MLLPLIMAVTVSTPQTVQPLAKPSATTAPAAAKPTLFAMVSSRMSAQGKPVFTRYVEQTLIPQIRAQAQAEATYRQQLQTIVAAPTLDVDATQRLIDQRKRADAASGDTIRASAFTMIKSLPQADRKLALTAIFADARLPAKTTSAAPAAKSK